MRAATSAPIRTPLAKDAASASSRRPSTDAARMPNSDAARSRRAPSARPSRNASPSVTSAVSAPASRLCPRSSANNSPVIAVVKPAIRPSAIVAHLQWVPGCASSASGGTIQPATAPSNCTSSPRITSARPFFEQETPGTIAVRSSIQSSPRSEEHRSELQSLIRSSYAVLCLKKKHIRDMLTNGDSYDNVLIAFNNTHKCDNENDSLAEGEN